MVEGWSHIGELLDQRKDRGSSAQFFFNQEVVSTVLEWLSVLQATRVLCIGCPRVHEALLRSAEAPRSLLLDMDDRMTGLFPGSAHLFNMCNATFIGESETVGAKKLRQIVRGATKPGQRLAPLVRVPWLLLVLVARPLVRVPWLLLVLWLVPPGVHDLP